MRTQPPRFHGDTHQPSAVPHAQLVSQLPAVVLNGIYGDAQLLDHLIRGTFGCDQVQHIGP